MTILSVADRLGFPLDPHSRLNIRSELTIRRNELWAQGNHYQSEDEIIEEVIDVLYEFDHPNTLLIHPIYAPLENAF